MADPRSSSSRSELGELQAVGCAELAQQVGDVGAHGLLGDHEVSGDLAVGASGDDVGQDFLLATGQARQRGSGPGGLSWFDLSQGQPGRCGEPVERVEDRLCPKGFGAAVSGAQ